MGVKTKIFGKHAWIVLETMCLIYDQMMEKLHQKENELKNNWKYKEEIQIIYSLMSTYMRLVGKVLPCVYCRISYRDFTNSDDSQTDIEHMLSLKNGAKKLIYNIHNKVNNKLKQQEIDEKKEPKHIILQRWKKKEPTFKEALQARYLSPNHYQFWYSLIIFLGLIMCDYEESSSWYIKQFFEITSTLLFKYGKICNDIEVLQLSKAYWIGLESSEIYWNDKKELSNNIKKRIQLVYQIQKYIFELKKNQWNFQHNLTDFEDTCMSAIVGCLQKEKN